ncbi:MAG: hypothetical protein HPAVJP_2030 [Candidatus Hepatoplasma vulgare]|nr:MAG: hypothetical protein HPAVJP_2030 [Candidatus Hepatoplasma sp.]
MVNNVNIYAYNRDANSGTREAFNTAIDFDSQNDKYSENVFETNGNDMMFDRVAKTKNSIGYVSLDTLYDDAGNVSRDGIKPLGTTAVPNPKDIKENIQNYEAKRPFNVFFRIPQDVSEYLHLPDNLYINSSEASSNGIDNIFSENFVIPSSWDLPPDVYQVNDEYEAKFAVSYLFFNWIFYSNEAKDLMDLAYEPINLTKYSYFDSIPQSGEEDVVENYIENTGLDDYFSSGGYDENNRLKITTQGSTSVVSLLNTLMTDEEEGFISILEDHNLYITYEQVHLGSGDAFKNSTPTSSEIFLGFQSRGFEDEEITGDDWGYDLDLTQTYDLVNQDDFVVDLNSEILSGFYNPLALYENGSYLLYGSFYIDAIVFIINDEIESNEGLDSSDIGYIDVKGVKDIYTNNVTWDDLYDDGLIGNYE